VLTEPGDDGRRPATLPLGLVLMGAGIFGWLAGRLLQAAISRQREFLADASAVKYTRHVDGIGGALRKIADEQQRRADGLRASTGALAHLFLARRADWSAWATHPPLAERLARLYGRPVEPLPASTPDARGTEEMEPLLPALAAQAAGIRTDGPHEAGGVPSALGHPTQERDRFQGGLEQQEEDEQRLERLARRHSPVELRAALLALLDVGDAAWQGVPSHLRAPLRNELEPLGASARETALDALARRAASLPRPWRRAVLRESAPTAGTPAGALRWLLLRALWRPTRRSAWKGAALDQAQPAAVLATRALAACLPSAPATAKAWETRALQALAVPDPDDGNTPPTLCEVIAALRRLDRVAPLQRPRVARAWMDATTHLPRSERHAANLLLGHALVLLDLPQPPALAQARPQWPGQERSL
jgi:hypothetical protein